MRRGAGGASDRDFRDLRGDEDVVEDDDEDEDALVRMLEWIY